jgi:polysaccharide biosynthesis protein PslH
MQCCNLKFIFFVLINILSIIPYKILPPNNGGQKGISVFTEYLSRHANAHAIGVSANDANYKTSYQTNWIISNHVSRYFNLFVYFRIKKMISANSIQYFILEHPYYAWLGYLLQKTTKAKWIIHSHNIEYMRFKSFGKQWWPILKYYETWAYRHANAVLCKTPEDKISIAQLIGNANTTLIDLPYGIENNSVPSDTTADKQFIYQKYKIAEGTKIMMFNGALDYAPNVEALIKIIDCINPILMQSNLQYKILICGGQLSDSFNQLKGYAHQHIVYCGFVDDISIYFRACDVFLNPVNSGGGVKTKLVEALGWNCNAVSTINGAIGIALEHCANKLAIVPNDDDDAFANAVMQQCISKQNTPDSFYNYYQWNHVVVNYLNIIATL